MILHGSNSKKTFLHSVGLKAALHNSKARGHEDEILQHLDEPEPIGKQVLCAGEAHLAFLATITKGTV